MPLFPLPAFSRRDFLAKGTLSAAGLVALTGVVGFAREIRAADASRDIDILNSALALEHEGIVAYQIGADTGLLKQPALNMALLFQSHHKTHRDTLIAAVQKIGGTPVAARPVEDYVKELNAAALKTQNDVLELATRLELAAANAYINIMPSFEDRDLALTAGRMVADEAMHWTALISTLQKPLPVNAMTFGVQQNP